LTASNAIWCENCSALYSILPVYLIKEWVIPVDKYKLESFDFWYIFSSFKIFCSSFDFTTDTLVWNHNIWPFLYLVNISLIERVIFDSVQNSLNIFFIKVNYSRQILVWFQINYYYFWRKKTKLYWRALKFYKN
jgi:hypothetical protein